MWCAFCGIYLLFTFIPNEGDEIVTNSWIECWAQSRSLFSAHFNFTCISGSLLVSFSNLVHTKDTGFDDLYYIFFLPPSFLRHKFFIEFILVAFCPIHIYTLIGQLNKSFYFSSAAKLAIYKEKEIDENQLLLLFLTQTVDFWKHFCSWKTIVLSEIFL